MPDKISEYILKHSKKINQELKYDFMPNILEIIERPAHKAGRIIIYLIFSLLIVAVVWASIAKTDIVVTASGSVVPEGDIITIKSYLSGTVDEIYVTAGQSVKKGDALVKLNCETEADITLIKKQIEIVNAEIDVYSKLLNNTDISKISSDSYSNNCKSYVDTILESENSYIISKESLELDRDIAKSEYDFAVTTHESSQNDKALYESQKVTVEQKKLQYDNAQLKIKSLETNHKQEMYSSYSEKKSELENLNVELEKYELKEKYCKIDAPTDGYVGKINVNSSGDTVNSYEEIISIIPNSAPLQMKCYVQNKDIADISVGNEVQIKLDAYPYSDYGTIPGKIIYISPESYTVENFGNVYEITVEIENDDENINIISGLSGSIEIKTGKRTVISYFLEPILDGFYNSLKEK